MLGRGLNCAHPNTSRCKGDGGQEVSGELVEACGDAAELLEFAEEWLDPVALPIEIWRNRALLPDAALSWDMRLSASLRDQRDQRPAVVAAIGDERASRRQPVEQRRGGRFVGRLTRRDQQPDRQAILIDDGMDLGAQSSTRTADGVIRTPFFPPAACWWARTMEESIRCSDCGERLARASNIDSHTPFFAQRLKRL